MREQTKVDNRKVNNQNFEMAVSRIHNNLEIMYKGWHDKQRLTYWKTTDVKRSKEKAFNVRV